MLFNICFARPAPTTADAMEHQEAGAIEMAVAALKAHPSDLHVVTPALRVLRKIVDGDAEDGVEKRCERATACGAIKQSSGRWLPEPSGHRRTQRLECA